MEGLFWSITILLGPLILALVIAYVLIRRRRRTPAERAAPFGPRRVGMVWPTLRECLRLPEALTGRGVGIALVDGSFAAHPDVSSDGRRRTLDGDSVLLRDRRRNRQSAAS